MGSQEARNNIGHDEKGKAAAIYEDNNPVERVKGAVALMCNGGTSYVPPKPPPVFKWTTVTPLLAPGALGHVGTPPWLRAINLANHIVNDASGKPFPRHGTERQKLDFAYGFYPDVRYLATSLLSLRVYIHTLVTPLWFLLQHPADRKLPQQVVLHAPEGPVRLLSPLLAGLDRATTADDFDAVAIARSIREHTAREAADAAQTFGQIPFPWLPAATAEAAAVGGLTRPPLPGAVAVEDGTGTAAAVGAAAAQATLSPGGRAATAAAGAAASPLSNLATAASAFGANAATFARLLIDAVSSRTERVIESFMQRQRPQDDTTRAGVAPPEPERPSAPVVGLILEPNDGPHKYAEAERIARQWTDARPAVRLIPVPTGLDWEDRFLLQYGAYRSSPDAQPHPPLWLAQYKNPGELWGEAFCRPRYLCFTPSYLAPLYFADYKKRQGIVSETGIWARFLLTKVLPRVQAGEPLTDAVRSAVIEARAGFAAHGLVNIKQICSGSPGGLGTKKATRAKKDGAAGGVADPVGGPQDLEAVV